MDIMYVENLHRYIVCAGMNFFIFDQNWNLLNAVNTNTQTINSSLHGLFFTENSLIAFRFSSSSPEGIKIPYWFGKKTIVKRTKSIDGNSKNFYYTLVENISVQDIEDGYFD